LISNNGQPSRTTVAPLAAVSFLIGLLSGGSYYFSIIFYLFLTVSFIGILITFIFKKTGLKLMLTVILIFSLLGIFRSHLSTTLSNLYSSVSSSESSEKINGEKKSEDTPHFIFLEKIRNNIRNNLNGSLSSEKSAYMRATLLGDEVDLGDSIEFSFKDCGLLHVIAISGQHLSIIFGGISLAVNIFPTKKVYRLIFALLLVTFYSMLTDFGPSIIRSLIMAVFLYGGLIIGRKAVSLNALSISFLLVTGYDPMILNDVGFQLSYLSTASILLFLPYIRRVLDFMPISVGEIMSASIASQIGIIPVLVLHFGYLSAVFLLANILAAPIVPIILISGLIFSIFPIRLFAMVLDGSLNLLFTIARLFYKNPVSSISIAQPDVGWITCYITFAVFLFLLFKKFSTGEVFGIICLLAIVCYLTFISIFPFISIKEKQPEVIFFDVKQGDSSLITGSDGKNILIDCGLDGASVCSFLAMHCIRKIDLLILTHLHDDHAGGALRIWDKFIVEKIAVPEYLSRSSELNVLKNKLRINEAVFYFIASGDVMEINDRIKLIVYWPNKSIGFSDDMNRYSLIFLADVEGSKILYLSDSDKDAADIALNKLISDLRKDKLDVIKVAHHGDAKALNKRLYQMTKPGNAIISVGKDNRFGHPGRELLEFLENEGIKYFRTDIDGDVSFKIYAGALSLVN